MWKNTKGTIFNLISNKPVNKWQNRIEIKSENYNHTKNQNLTDLLLPRHSWKTTLSGGGG